MAHLSHLTLANFRNFIQLELDLNPGVCVFFGANAQGKTTLLEAVYLLAIARSFRAKNEREVVNFGAALQGEPALVGGAIEKREERLAVYIGYQPQPVRGATSASLATGEKPNGGAINRRPALGWPWNAGLQRALELLGAEADSGEPDFPLRR